LESSHWQIGEGGPSRFKRYRDASRATP
jgi:hypothetical protein